MSTYTFTIGGTPRVVLVETFGLKETLNAADTLFIDVRAVKGAIYRPPVNDPIYMFAGATTIFGGLVEAAYETGIGGYGNAQGIVTRVTAKSFYNYLTRFTVNATFAAGTLKSQLTALVALIPAVFGMALDGSQANGPTMEEFTFTNLRGDEVLTTLLTAATAASGGTGWVARVDPNKNLLAWAVGTVAAPNNVVEGDGNARNDLTPDSTRNDLYANKINGVFSGAGPATSTEYFTAADGVTVGGFIYFTTKYPASTSINDAWPSQLFFNSTNMGPIGRVGPNPNDVPTNAWDWDPANHRLRYTIASGAAFPTTEQITVTYAIGYPFTLTAIDAVAYAADPWERTIEIPQAFSLAAAQALLDGMLAQQSPVKEEIRYQTVNAGFHPGQTQSITSASRGLSSPTTVLIQEVNTKRLSSTKLEVEISAVPSQVFQGTFRNIVEQWMKIGTTRPSGGVATTGVAGPPVTGIPILHGSGNPQAVVTAAVGSLYIDDLTGDLYRKVAGSGNTGWYFLHQIGTGGGLGPQYAFMAASDSSAGIPNGQGGFANYSQTNLQHAAAFDQTWYTLAVTNSSTGTVGGFRSSVEPFWWDNDFDLSVMIRTSTTVTDARIWCGFISADFTNSDTMADKGIAFRFSQGTDAGWVAVCRDGTTQSVSSSLGSVAVSTRYHLRIRFIRASNTAYFSINDGPETAITANIPAAGTRSAVAVYIYNKNATAQTLYFRYAGCTFGA